jgi:hypothetical protein
MDENGGFFFFFNFNFVLGLSSAFCLQDALQPMWLMPEVYCTIPIFLIIPTLAARCLSRPATSNQRRNYGRKCWPDDAWDM